MSLSSFDSKFSTETSADHASFWFLRVVLALSLAMSAQTLWWMWHPVYEYERGSTWSVLRTIALTMNHLGWREPLAVGGGLVMIALVGVMLRRSWGLGVLLVCAVALISAALLGRYIAIFQEPRQYVGRSVWVRSANQIVLAMLVSHGVAALLALRLLWRDRAAPTSPVRAAMLAQAALAAVVPVLWIAEGSRNAGATLVILCAAVAALLTGAVAAILARRPLVRGALAVGGIALAAQLITFFVLLAQRPRRHHLHSRAAEDALPLLVTTAPALLVLVGLTLVLHRRMSANAAPVETAEAGAARA